MPESKKYRTIRAVVSFLFHLLARIEVAGVENIPQEGPLIVAINHVSRLDTVVLGITPTRHIYAFAASKYKSYPLFRWILEAAGVIWVRRTDFDREALLQAIELLRRGEALGIAPEGTRSRTGALQPAKSGVAFLAARTGATIIPVAITGTQHMVRDFKHLRRMRIRVVYGQPFRLSKEGRLSSAELQEATTFIMHRIAELLPPEYRGVYADAGRADA